MPGPARSAPGGPNAGPTAVQRRSKQRSKQRSNGGKVARAARPAATRGQTAVKYWSNSGLIVVKYWSNTDRNVSVPSRVPSPKRLFGPGGNPSRLLVKAIKKGRIPNSIRLAASGASVGGPPSRARRAVGRARAGDRESGCARRGERARGRGKARGGGGWGEDSSERILRVKKWSNGQLLVRYWSKLVKM